MHTSLKKLSLIVISIACYISLGISDALAQQPPTEKKSKNKVIRIYDTQSDTTSAITVENWKIAEEQMLASGLTKGNPGNYRIGSSMSATYSFPGKNPTRPEFVRVTFRAYGTGKYEKQHDYTVKVDGEQLLQGEAEYKKQDFVDYGNGMIYEESVTLVMPLDSFIRLSNAEKVQVKIGPTEFDLNERQRDLLKALAVSIDKCEKPDCRSGTFNPSGTFKP